MLRLDRPRSGAERGGHVRAGRRVADGSRGQRDAPDPRVAAAAGQPAARPAPARRAAQARRAAPAKLCDRLKGEFMKPYTLTRPACCLPCTRTPRRPGAPRWPRQPA